MTTQNLDKDTVQDELLEIASAIPEIVDDIDEGQFDDAQDRLANIQSTLSSIQTWLVAQVK